ncbi:hypothetical protein Peur_015734 [Populus x canadensis]
MLLELSSSSSKRRSVPCSLSISGHNSPSSCCPLCFFPAIIFHHSHCLEEFSGGNLLTNISFTASNISSP